MEFVQPFIENKSNSVRQMAVKIVTFILILAEIESKKYDQINVDKLKNKLIKLKSIIKDSIQQSLKKTNPLTRINLKDDVKEIIKDRKRSSSMSRVRGSALVKGNEPLSLEEEMEMLESIPKAEPIPEDIMTLDYVQGILKICNQDLANCILSQDWKNRKSALLMIAKHSQYLWTDDQEGETNICLKWDKLEKRVFLKNFKNVVMFIMSDNVAIL